MPKDSGFLMENFRDCQEWMRWRATVEFRLLQSILLIYPVIVAAMAALHRSSIDQKAYWMLSILASLFILGTSWAITKKIQAEHRVYTDIGLTVQKIWSYFDLFKRGAYLKEDSILPEALLDPDKDYGAGPGYGLTLRIIWIITFGVIVLIMALAAAVN